MDSLARDVQSQATLRLISLHYLDQSPETYHGGTDTDNQQIDNSQADLPRGGKPSTPVDVQPVHPGETVTEPTGKKRALCPISFGSQQASFMTYNQADNISERGNPLSDDPGDDPATQPNGNP